MASESPAREPLEALAALVAAELKAAPIGRRAITRAEAAAALGVSLDFFEDHVQGQLRLIRLGRKCLVPVAELDRWLSDAAERTFDR
jgi:excisionase family DNA binding protein